MKKVKAKSEVREQSKETTAVAAYLGALSRYPQLKHPEVVELFKKLETPGNEAEKARKKLIECNLRLVVSIAKLYRNHNIPIEDLIQEGNIGLMKSITKFDWTKGFRFSTYATWWVKQAIGQHVLKRKRIIRLPAHAVAVQRKMIKASEEFREANGLEPTAEDLLGMTGVSQTVLNATLHSGRGTVSLQQPVSSRNENDTLEDKIIDERDGSNPFENVSEKEMIDVANRVLEQLTPKEAAILRLRFGLIDNSVDRERYRVTKEEAKSISQGKSLR